MIILVKRRSQRFAAVQISFQGGGARNYLIWYRTVWGHEAEWLACSLPGEVGPADLDFRRKRDIARVAKELGRIDVDSLVEAMRAQ
jgi:hypothetical protein